MRETPETTVPQSPERVFPPWSIETLVAWTVAYIALAFPISYLYGWAIARANAHLQFGIDVLITLLIRGNTAIALHALLGFLFILFFLKRAGFSLRNIWGTYSAKSVHLGIGLLIGGSIVVVSSMVFTSIREQIIAPPVNPVPIDWRLLFATETASLAAGCLAEELLFRGLLYQAIRLKNTAYRAAVFSALIFTGSHIHHFANPPQLVSDLFLGLFSAFLFERSHSLTSCVILHFAANITVVTLYYMNNFC